MKKSMMKNWLLMGLLIGHGLLVTAQSLMTPETLWSLGRLSPIGLSEDGQFVVYKVTHPSVEKNSFSSAFFKVSVNGGKSESVEDPSLLVKSNRISPNGKYIMYSKPVQVEKIKGSEVHSDLSKSSAMRYDGLDYRHWDTWNDGSYNHVFYRDIKTGSVEIDIMAGESFNCPQKPFGGNEDFIWSPEGSSIVYVSKKLKGTQAANSTNTDIYVYHLDSKKTENLTPNNPGYDTHPLYSSKGDLAWLQMRRDGYEADKNDIMIKTARVTMNVTGFWDGSVSSFTWSEDGNSIFLIAPVSGTLQLHRIENPGKSSIPAKVVQLTEGDFDVNSIVGFSGDKVLVTRSDFNHASEIYSFDLTKKSWQQLTHVNESIYAKVKRCTSSREMVKTTDGKDMLVWVIYPPDFDPKKKYPTLLYCQGGPQSALTPYYSFRWNFQLMASQGYIVVAPNRRGMPGHGVKWNEQISGDWGGQVMQDYLSAIDHMSKKPFVDEKRLGAVGASYGGYSVFYLAGIHENRFKSFISHCGVFNTESMYGTTEELFFVNWDLKGPYWDKNEAVQRAYTEFNPKNHVEKWNTPMLVIQGGKDYRVPVGQGQEAFQALQQRGIQSRFLYFPEENHWILQPQNGILWQREFFNWLKETL
jgi:dipeptidyl aminopeptidase/acylaminoacyl peptidase